MFISFATCQVSFVLSLTNKALNETNLTGTTALALAIANYFTGETIPKEVLRSTMLSKIPPKLHELNNKAYDLGYKYAKEADNRK